MDHEGAHGLSRELRHHGEGCARKDRLQDSPHVERGRGHQRLVRVAQDYKCSLYALREHSTLTFELSVIDVA